MCRRSGLAQASYPEQWRLLYSLNPMVGVIDGFRWCLLGGESQLYLPGLAMSTAVTVFFLWLGIRTIQKNGKELCGSDLRPPLARPMSDTIISVEHLSKTIWSVIALPSAKAYTLCAT